MTLKILLIKSKAFRAVNHCLCPSFFHLCEIYPAGPVCSGQGTAAFRTEGKILVRLISAGRAALHHTGSPAAPDHMQVRRTDLDLFSAGNAGTDLGIELIDRAAAGHLHVILFSPFKTGNKEEQKLGKCHEHLISSILTALRADHELITGEVLSPLCDADHQKHICSSLSGPDRSVLCRTVFYLSDRTAVYYARTFFQLPDRSQKQPDQSQIVLVSVPIPSISQETVSPA